MPLDAHNTIDPLSLTRDAFVAAVGPLGVGQGRAKALYTAFFREGSGDAWPELERGSIRAPIPPIVDRLDEPCDEGITTKAVLRVDNPGRLSDQGAEHLDIECVVIPMLGRTGKKTHTLCVSSQVGCAMGCGFCETAQMGLIRSLAPREIVAQWWVATHVLGVPIDNIVFMGMGEPLDNLDNVLQAIAVLTDHTGANMPMSAVTISTVGRVDGLRRLVDVVQRPGWKRLGLALSVNAPNDEVRNEIMPLNKKWGMDDLRRVMMELVEVRKNKKLLFEYVLIPGVNDRREHAEQLAAWLHPFTRDGNQNGTGHIGLLNVIPYNPRRDSPWPAPDEDRVHEFVLWLRSMGVFVKRRRTKGRAQMAACGQLGAAHIRGRRLVQLTGTPTGERVNGG